MHVTSRNLAGSPSVVWLSPVAYRPTKAFDSGRAPLMPRPRIRYRMNEINVLLKVKRVAPNAFSVLTPVARALACHRYRPEPIGAGNPGAEPVVDGPTHRPLPQARRRDRVGRRSVMGPAAHDRRTQARRRGGAHTGRGQAGLPLTHLALAYAITHPAVTSAIIGPRTMEQLDDLVAGDFLPA